MFSGKTLLITGGTGSFGNAVLNRFLDTDIGEIRIFSRDEKKQDDMRHYYQSLMPQVSDKIKFFIGDVRDLNSCSRGSVIPLFIDQIKAGKPLTVTDASMTRFIMSLDEAIDLVLFAFENGASGDILVQKAPACTIEVLAQAVKELFHAENEIKVIGIRHGEKMYETLLTNEECASATDMGNFYRVPCDKRDLNYDKYFRTGDTKRNPLTEFNSNNTVLLGTEQVKAKLLELKYIRDEIAALEER